MWPNVAIPSVMRRGLHLMASLRARAQRPRRAASQKAHEMKTEEADKKPWRARTMRSTPP